MAMFIWTRTVGCSANSVVLLFRHVENFGDKLLIFLFSCSVDLLSFDQSTDHRHTTIYLPRLMLTIVLFTEYQTLPVSAFTSSKYSLNIVCHVRNMEFSWYNCWSISSDGVFFIQPDQKFQVYSFHWACRWIVWKRWCMYERMWKKKLMDSES